MAKLKILLEIGMTQQPLCPNDTSSPLSTFYFNPLSVAQQTTACKWANIEYSFEPPSYYCPKGYWLSSPSAKVIIVAQTRPNYIMKNLVLKNLEARGEGGRAYKVVNIIDNSLFDIREDQMIQAILKYGIQPGGLIGGNWVFAMNHTQVKCFLTDSDEYLEALENNNLTTHPVP